MTIQKGEFYDTDSNNVNFEFIGLGMRCEFESWIYCQPLKHDRNVVNLQIILYEHEWFMREREKER